MEYRNFTITASAFGFNVDGINCFGARSEEAAKRASDRYLNGDNDPQCRSLGNFQQDNETTDITAPVRA